MSRRLASQLNEVKFSLKFIYSEKATNFCEISTADLTGTTQDKSTAEISQNFVTFSEYMNFTYGDILEFRYPDYILIALILKTVK